MTDADTRRHEYEQLLAMHVLSAQEEREVREELAKMTPHDHTVDTIHLDEDELLAACKRNEIPAGLTMGQVMLILVEMVERYRERADGGSLRMGNP